MTGTQDRYSYLRLRDEVAHLAGALRALGVGKGDRVIIYADGAAGSHVPCSPARAWAQCTRWCSAVRSLRAGPAHRRRHAEAGAHRFLRAGVRPR
ncbi:hypothetical protein P4238_02030 [Pseudomonas aeruginosa]|nr:hypothetical protein [Pseudomonas aeruginosa]